MAKETSMKGQLEFELEIIQHRELSFIVSDGEKTYCLPKSVVDWVEPDHAGATTTFYVPRWKAEQEGMV